MKNFDDIRPGDRISFAMPLRGRDTVETIKRGRVVFKFPDRAVVNGGGRHGTPYVVTPETLR